MYWDKLKNQCKSCERFQAMEIRKETDNFYYWECQFCGFKKKHLREWAIYKHKNGITFLKRPGWDRFREVDLVSVKRGIQVKEVGVD